MDATTESCIRELTADETEALLRARAVGRIAYSWHDHVDVEPVHYVYEDRAIHGRTSAGAKLLALRHNPWVAFEVDEVLGPYDWRSVVAHGTVYVLHPEGTPADRLAYARALDLARRIEPAALTARDPVPWRTVLFRISVDHVTGREARSGDSGD
jgi:uncharacterized protein